jgi:Bacterial archaeo-eukaryotic release factor family 11
MLHIDLPTRADIERLASERATPTVSIYLRTTPVTQDTGTDRLELKALLRTAVEQMEAAGTPKRSIWPVEEAITGLVEDRDFWAVQANSLAVFATPERLLTFRLPNHLQNMVEVSDRAHLKPLIRAVTFPHNAYLLAISIGACRLVEVTADLPPHPVEVPGLPRDFNEALGRRSHTEKSGGMSSGTHTSEHAMFARYARAVDAALRPVLAGHERPLIVAAAEPLASIYRSVSSYPHTAAPVIPGSADQTPDHELAAAARDVLDAVYADEIRALAALYATREGQGRATADIAQAARAATFGAVDTLIFDMDETVHGTIDEETGAVGFAEAPGAGSYGLVDEVAARALRSGARLVAARRDDVPGGGSLAAILRYPV